MPAFLGSGWRPAFSSRVQLLHQSAYDFLHPCHSLHPSHPYLHLTESPCAAILEAWRTGGSRAPGLLSFGSRAKSKDEGWAYPKAHCLLQHLGSLSPARLQWHQLQAPPPPPEIHSSEIPSEKIHWPKLTLPSSPPMRLIAISLFNTTTREILLPLHDMGGA